MRAPLSYIPALPACTGMVAGIVISGVAPWWIVTAVCAAAYIAAYAASRHYLSFFLLMTAIGAAAVGTRTPEPLPDDLYGVTRLYTAKVVTASEQPRGMVYVTDITGVDSAACRPFRCQVTVASVFAPMEPGWTFSFRGKLENTADSGDLLPGMPDTNRMLRLSGVRASAYLLASDIGDRRAATGWQASVNTLRRAAFNAIVTAPVTGETASFLVAVILGDDLFLTPSREDMYRAAGVAHLLAVSGLHVGVIAMIFGFMVFPLRLWRRSRAVRLCLTAVLVWAYVVLVGAQPSVLRAAVMITVTLAASLVQRGSSPWNSLCLAAVIILFIHPLWLYTPGFLLSVAAVVSLLLFVPLLPGRLKRHPALYYGLQLVIVPVAAMLGTGIVTAWFFGYLPLFFLPANIVCGVLFPLILGCGFALMLAGLCGVTLAPLGWLADTCMRVMDGALSLLSGTGAPVAAVPPFSAWVVLPYAVALVLLALALRHPRRPALWALTASAALATVTVWMATRETPPRFETYLTSRAGRTELLVCRDRDVWLRSWPDGVDTLANDHYAPFARYRRCDSIEQVSSLSLPEAVVSESHASLGGTVVLVADDSLRQSVSGVADVYWLVTAGYHGGIAPLRHMAPGSTVIIGADNHPSRRAMLRRQCADSVHCIDLRGRALRMDQPR